MPVQRSRRRGLGETPACRKASLAGAKRPRHSERGCSTAKQRPTLLGENSGRPSRSQASPTDDPPALGRSDRGVTDDPGPRRGDRRRLGALFLHLVGQLGQVRAPHRSPSIGGGSPCGGGQEAGLRNGGHLPITKPWEIRTVPGTQTFAPRMGAPRMGRLGRSSRRPARESGRSFTVRTRWKPSIHLTKRRSAPWKNSGWVRI